MRIIKLKLKKNSYDILTGIKILPLLGRFLNRLKIGRDAYIITNNRIKKLYGNLVAKSLKSASFNFVFKTVPDTEKAKDIKVATSLIKDLAKFDLKRKPFIIALGGGVIGDLSGFVASIYKRGIPYIQVPTTLLAQVDSAIGGKTAIDLKEGKNLVGAFYQPKMVLSDVSCLTTLTKKDIKSGLAEVIKYGLIKDSRLFVYLEKNYKKIINLNKPSLEYIVNSCSRIKAMVVSSDEKEEKGIRTILNFGHTIGHAIEAASGFKGYTHGEAIALGMLVSLRISVELKLIGEEEFERVESLVRNIGLPVKIEGVSLNSILRKHYHDKKFSGKSNKFVLLSKLGRVKIINNLPLEIIRSAIRDRIYL
ncbi:MAG: 3-dehydroquinate synthase [Candidatus Omnitrophota bacterium]